jgi:carbon-monoxide dehydrogenase medium subunit
MKPARFCYVRVDSVEEAVAVLAEHGHQARILAGGQSLAPLMHRRLLRPSALVDVGRLHHLRYLKREGDLLRVGALTRHHDIETVTDPAVTDGFAVLPEAAKLIAHYPIRTRGTVGGSIAHADPVAEWCLLAVLLDADVVLVGPDGERVVPAADFLIGRHATAAAPDEMVVEVRFPPAPRAALCEFALRDGDFAVVAAAADVRLDGDRITAAKIAVGGVAGRPVRFPAAEESLAGASPSPAAFEQAAQLVAGATQPAGDIHGSAQHRRELAAELSARALQQATKEASRWVQQEK